MVSEGFRSTEGKGRSYTPFTPTFTLTVRVQICFFGLWERQTWGENTDSIKKVWLRVKSCFVLPPWVYFVFHRHCSSSVHQYFYLHGSHSGSLYLPMFFCTNLWTLWQSISLALLPTPLFVLLQMTKVTWDLQSPQHDSGIMRAGRRPVIDRDVCPLSLTSDLVYYHLSPSLCITTVYHPAPAAPRWQQKMNEWTLNASTSLFDK